MQKYIALLRGINVSGKNTIKMADLKPLIESLGFSDVVTYIQSGNILFKAEGFACGQAAAAISGKIKESYGYDVRTLVLTAEEMAEAIAEEPFIRAGRDPKRVYLTFLAETPQPELAEKLSAADYFPEETKIVGKTVYFYSPESYGNAKMNNNFLEKQLKTTATTRNWNSVEAIGKLIVNC